MYSFITTLHIDGWVVDEAILAGPMQCTLTVVFFHTIALSRTSNQCSWVAACSWEGYSTAGNPGSTGAILTVPTHRCRSIGEWQGPF